MYLHYYSNKNTCKDHMRIKFKENQSYVDAWPNVFKLLLKCTNKRWVHQTYYNSNVFHKQKWHTCTIGIQL